MQDSGFTKNRPMSALLTRMALAAGGTTLLFAGIAQAAAPAQPPRAEEAVTKAQADKAAQAYFAKLDVNGDGKIDAADRQAARERKVASRFDALDANHDGAVSKAEFIAARMSPDGPADGPAPEGRRADGPDGRHDGRQGDRHEGRSGRGPMGRAGMVPREAAVQVLTRFADTNHDGAISKAEFFAAADRRFAMIDANHDGRITQDERREARDAILSQGRDNWNADKAPSN